MERTVDADTAQVVEGDRDCTVVLAEHHAIIDAQTRRHRQFDRIRRS